jgi:hypothetical protein
MNIENSEVEYLKPLPVGGYKAFLKQPPLNPFSEYVSLYLNALFKTISRDDRVALYPDVATFSFFCRRANTDQLKKKYGDSSNVRLGRGVIFHISPSNVAVNFAFSLVAGLLAGNSNIVRVPSKRYEQIEIIVDAINELSRKEQYSIVSDRIVLVRYSRTSSATGSFSEDCDVRIIWGGDETIRNIRRNMIGPRAFDITFADRYSICVINADKLVLDPKLMKLANDFYNDTYLFDQNACTSPHLVVWIGSKSNVIHSKKLFWTSVESATKNRYSIQAVQAVDKLTNFYSQAIQSDSIIHTVGKDNLIWRVELTELSEGIEDFQCSSGYFSEYHATDLAELFAIINKKYQTLSYYGFSNSELNDFINRSKPSGIDRIVPVGRTMDFSMIWDGYNLIETLTRKIEII